MRISSRVVGISRIVVGWLLAPLVGVYAANVLSFALWAFRAPGIEVSSSAQLLQMYGYVLVMTIAAWVVTRRFSLWGLWTWLTVGAISALPACVNNIWFWYEASGGVDAEFVVRYLVLYVFAGAVAGGVFWLLAIVGNRPGVDRGTEMEAG